MELSSKTYINKRKINQILLILLILSLFFPLRHVFYSNSAYWTGSYSDFTSFSLYLSDILAIGLFLVNLRHVVATIRRHWLIGLLLGWIILATILNSRHLLSLNFYFIAKFIEFFLVYLLFAHTTPFLHKNTLAFLFSLLGGLESIITIIQFATQKSVGLYRLGESHLGTTVNGVAKLVSHGTLYIRGYGTFPHSNLLSAFLLVSVLFSLYLIFSSAFRKHRLVFSGLLILNLFGLALSFSRAGIGATIAAVIIFLAFLFYLKIPARRILWASAVLAISAIVIGILLSPFLLSRATISDQAVKERVFYNEIGVKMIKAYPWQGIGFGTSVLHMQQFSPVQLQPWEIQPIHNYYLLSAAELGIVGGLLFILLFGWHASALLIKLLRSRDMFQLTLFATFCGFLILMLFDHYFYTIEQTQFLLWLVLGLVMREINNRTTTD